MQKLIFKLSILLVITLLLALNFTWVRTDEILNSETPTYQPDFLADAKKLDPKAEILNEYLAKHNSPLQDHAQDFIDAANLYNLDWRLVAAIAGTESTFGKHIPGGFNGWGWGVYGNQALGFQSWTDGIFTVSKGLRENYVNIGLSEPYKMNRKYAASPHWAKSVTFFMNDLERFSKNYQVDNSLGEADISIIKIAAASGKMPK